MHSLSEYVYTVYLYFYIISIYSKGGFAVVALQLVKKKKKGEHIFTHLQWRLPRGWCAEPSRRPAQQTPYRKKTSRRIFSGCCQLPWRNWRAASRNLQMSRKRRISPADSPKGGPDATFGDCLLVCHSVFKYSALDMRMLCQCWQCRWCKILLLGEFLQKRQILKFWVYKNWAWDSEPKLETNNPSTLCFYKF